MTTGLEIHGTLLARNTVMNLVGNVIPLLVGLATIPYVARGLGADGFGILSIAWVLLGYFSLFDLGLGRATTKFVADALGRGEVGQIPGLVWTSLGFQFLFGAAGGLVVAAVIPFLVNRVLKIPPSLIGETKVTFFILAASLPVVLATNALRGVLEAGQRFDLVNYVKAPANISVFLLPAIALALGLHLPGIVLLLILARLAATLAYLVLCFKVFPALARTFLFEYWMLRPMLTYGGWLTVSNIVAPVLTYMDRFVIGTLVSIAAVGYYTAPSEMATRLWFIPFSMSATLFPAFSSLEAAGAKQRLEEIYSRSVKVLLLTLGPMLLVIAVFASDILRLWLGEDFAVKGTLVLQILSIGVLINSLASAPYCLLQGTGRPDVPAKFHLLELPLYAGVLWFLVERAGIAGAAVAWSLRQAVDATLLFWFSCRLRRVSFQALITKGILWCAGTLFGLGVILPTILTTGHVLLVRLFLSVLVLALFGVIAWSQAVDRREKSAITSAFSQGIAALRGTK